MRINLLSLALLPLVVGPALANPPCRSCAVRAKARVVIKRQVVIKKVIDAIPIFVPTYTATIAPYAVAAPIYAPLPPPQAPVQMQAPLYPQVQQQSYGQYQLHQQRAYAQQYAAPMPAKQECVTNDRLAMLLEQLCVEVRSMRGMPNGNGRENGNGYDNGNGETAQPARLPKNGNGLPRVFNKCSACHSATAANDGGGFSMFDAGKLRPDFSERDLRLILQKVQLGQMPPQNRKGIEPATDEEVSELAQWMAKQE